MATKTERTFLSEHKADLRSQIAKDIASLRRREGGRMKSRDDGRMTIKELRHLLKKFNDEQRVFVSCYLGGGWRNHQQIHGIGDGGDHDNDVCILLYPQRRKAS